MKDELGGEFMTKDWTKSWTKSKNVIDDNSEEEKAEGTTKSVIKRKLKFENYENCLEATQLENKIDHLEQ